MKLTFEREKLLHAFQLAASVAPARSPKPVLQNVKLEVTPETTTLMATDLEVSIRTEVSGVVTEVPGIAVLPINRFGSILRESSDEKLNLECDGAKARVKGARSDFHLLTQNPDEFPEIREFAEERYHQVAARLFRELVHRTVFATDNESSRYALGGVLLELTADKIVGVATDGRRLAKQEGPAKSIGGHATKENTIVPTRSMQLLERAVADNEEEIRIAVRDNDAMVKSQRTTIITRLVEGRFPKWRDVFPRQDQMTRVELTVGPFYSAVRQSAIVVDENHRGVEFTFGEGRVILSGRGAETGEALVELPIAYDGAALPVMLDPRFVADFLKVLDPDGTFSIYIRNAESAVIASTDDGYSYVIMPLARD